MVAYSTYTFANSTIFDTFALQAVTYELKIVQINFWQTGPASWLKIYRSSSSMTTDGDSIPVFPLRQGAPAASAKASVGSSVRSGSTLVGELLIGPGGETNGTVAMLVGANAQFSTPVTMTLKPGHTLYIAGLVVDALNFNSSDVRAIVYFEEIRLLGSY